MKLHWPYYTFVDGKLFTEDGYRDFPEKTFTSAEEAQKFLEDNDIRGDVK